MDVNVVGRVKNTKLADRHALMPLFEAIVNSIHAIHDRQVSPGCINVTISRDPQQSFGGLHWKAIPDILGFEITDDGAGFTQENYNSFNTIDSRAKESRGGRGIGRILWLKAFDRVDISSVYVEDSTTYHRQFSFLPSPGGVEGESLEELDIRGPDLLLGTSVRLTGFKKRYRDNCPKSIDAIARRIIEHCLEYYLMDEMPKIYLRESHSDEYEDLGELYKRDYQPASQPRKIQVGSHTFDIVDVFLRGTREGSHQLFFCAQKRAVCSLKLIERITHLEETLTNKDHQLITYAGYVSGEFLEERVNSQRFEFDIDHRGEFGLNSDVAWEDIEEAAVASAESTLEPVLADTKARAWKKVENFIMDEAPKFRPLLNHRVHALAQLPGNLSLERMDAELYRILSEWRQEVRKEATTKLSAKVTTAVKFSEYRKQFAHLFEELADVAKSELAEYVVHRRLILAFFQKLLGLQTTQKFALEEAVHDIIFPMRMTSDSVDYMDHNLWIVDERLAYHQYLASDIPFNQQSAPISVDGTDRPDLLVFNRPIALAQGEMPFSSVVVIEFKRPERDDYTGEENPIRQVLKYVDLLRSGKAKRPDGSSVNVPPNIPFYCYIIASVTPALEKEAELSGFKKMPDGAGFFNYNENYNSYTEILSFHKVLADAKKRNQIFFDKLQIPVHLAPRG